VPVKAGAYLLIGSFDGDGTERLPRRGSGLQHTLLTIGILLDLTIVGVDRVQADRAGELVKRDFAFMHPAWNAWEPSPLARTNRLISKRQTNAAPPSILPMIRKSRDCAERSKNGFNPAIAEHLKLFGEDVDVEISARFPRRLPESG
jgi:thiamine biosynthesis lipoprotein ApbE